MNGNGNGSYEGFVEFDKEMRPPDHARRFDEALQKAVDAVPDGDTGPFEVTYTITVRHTSPGWIDGYRVVLKPRP